MGDFGLHADEFRHGNLPVGDFIEHCLDFQGIDFFHFTCDEHRLDSDDMQTGREEGILLELEVSVHEFNSREIGFMLEFVHGHDFDHPIQHSGSKGTIDFMCFEEVFGAGEIAIDHGEVGCVVMAKILSGRPFGAAWRLRG